MSTHDFYGQKINFGHDTEDAKSLFRHEHNKHEAERHLAAAAEHGESHFYIGDKRYKVTTKEEGGEKVTSVDRSHH